MLREDFYELNDDDERYYRDAYFQLSHLLETAETYREFLADLRDSYMSAVSLSLNEVMKTDDDWDSSPTADRGLGNLGKTLGLV